MRYYVVICSSLYHFTDRADDIVTRLRRAARRALIVSEPVRNLSQLPVVGRLASAPTDPGVGDGDGHLRRFDLETFTALVARHGGRVTHHAGDRNALAATPPLAASGASSSRRDTATVCPRPANAGRG